jgi:polysaccharide export outer membrane protein/exopolysaccharide production protein ExoF
VQAKIEDAARRFDAARGLLQAAETLANGEQREGRRVEPVFTIIRQGSSGIAAEISAADSTPVLPGDTIKVDLPAAQGQPTAPPASLAAQQEKHPS